MNNNPLIKTMIVVIFFTLLLAYFNNMYMLLKSSDYKYFDNSIVCLGFIGTFLYLKVIHDKIR